MRFLLPDLLYSQGSLRPDLAVGVADGRITGVVTRGSVPQGAAVERLAGKALLPGFVNAHSHAFQRGLRGHVQYTVGPDPTSSPGPEGAGGGFRRSAVADSFWTWRDRMYSLANALDPDGVEAVSALAFLEMARAGFTTVGEFHYLQHAPDGTRYADPDELALRVVAAAARVGIHIVLLRVAYARAGFGLPDNPLQRRFYDRGPDDVLAAVARLRARGIAAGIAPHSVRACPAPWLAAFAGFDGPIHAHVDEQPAEIEASLREHGVRPLQAFANAGILSPQFVAVHLTHPDDSELVALHGAGAGVAVCPTTELDLGDGFFPLERYLLVGQGGEAPRNAPPGAPPQTPPGAAPGAPAPGAPTGTPGRAESVAPRGRALGRPVSTLSIGTDSHAQIDPFAELRAVELHARAVTGRRNVWAHPNPDGLAAALLDVGTAGGAAALGVNAGAITVGGRADLVAVDLDAPALRGARVLPALVFAGHPGLVTDVWVAGARIVEAGRHPAEVSIVAAAERALARAET